MKEIELDFGDAGKALAMSLSAFVRVGDSIFAGADEGVKMARLEARDGGRRFLLQELIDLSKWFDLPIPPSGSARKVKEIDLEGMDLDRDDNVLWLLGSHSLKRGKAEAGVANAENLKALGEVKVDANRFFLGCVRLRDHGGNLRLAEDGPQPGDARAAQLVGDATTSELLDEIRRDPLFERFCRDGAGIPGKDNGVDFEGLACAPGGRVLVGMRGPVLRGIAIVLELAPERIASPTTKADHLRLTTIGPDARKYRRHFLDLGGNGIRDLCWDDGDLLVLAGPTAGLDAAPLIFRWKSAKEALGKTSGDEEQFFWRADGALVIERYGADWKQEAPGVDHAEAITLVGKKQLAIGYDSPGKTRLRKPAAVSVDVLDL
jgi:uncharacterized protein DUF3616